MRKVDFFAAIGLLGFVAVMVMIVIPNENAEGVWHGLSPYFYPMVMLAGVGLSSIGLLVQAMTKPSEYESQPQAPLTWSELGFFLLISAIILGSVLVFHWFGTWAGGIVLIAATMVFMGEVNPLRIATVALPTLAVTYAIVTWALKIPLP
ncbi:MAG: tripartite tricarboxylate transporter TctB family protein [Hyphomicrobiaceae bacterium]|nr:tripartite tricarboxylate transporter TctB family protein [Hyphomicrobiaceae bacterium]